MFRPSLENRNTELEISRTQLAKAVTSSEAIARTLALRTYHDSFSGSVMVRYAAKDSLKILDNPTREALSEFLLTPYESISLTLSSGDSKFINSSSSVPREIKDEYHTRIRAALEANKSSLSKNQDDINMLLVKVKEQLSIESASRSLKNQLPDEYWVPRLNAMKILHDSHRKELNRTTIFLDSFLAESIK